MVALMNAYEVQNQWVKYSQEQRDREQRRQQEASKAWDASWHRAGAWCAEHLPDLIDRRTGASCGFAVGAALKLRNELGRTPSPGEVRRARAAWLKQLDVEGDT